MSAPISKEENRSAPRQYLPLKVRVAFQSGRESSWEEDAIALDVSICGAGIILQRPAKRGRIARLSIPMPLNLRRYDLAAETYTIWAVVRRCVFSDNPTQGPGYATGFAFIGPQAPGDFENHPSRLYRLAPAEIEPDGFWKIVDTVPDPGDITVRQEERRKETRFSIPEDLTLELLDEGGTVVASEPTVTENISLGGAIVFSDFYAEIGTVLRVTSKRHDVAIISIVRGRQSGPGNSSRYNIEFIDQVFPLHGIG